MSGDITEEILTPELRSEIKLYIAALELSNQGRLDESMRPWLEKKIDERVKSWLAFLAMIKKIRKIAKGESSFDIFEELVPHERINLDLPKKIGLNFNLKTPCGDGINARNYYQTFLTSKKRILILSLGGIFYEIAPKAGSEGKWERFWFCVARRSKKLTKK